MNTGNRCLGASLFVKKYDYCIIFLLSFLYVRWDVLWRGNGLGVALFAFLFCAFVRLRLEPIPPERLRAARPWMLVIAASALQSAWFDSTPLGWINTVFLSVCAMYWMMILSGRRIQDGITSYLPMDLFCQMIRVPFSNFGRLFGAIFRTPYYRRDTAGDFAEAPGRSRDGQQSAGEAVSAPRHRMLRSAVWIAFTLVLAAPLFFVVLGLLASADADFMRVIGRLIDYAEGFWEDFMTVQIALACWDLIFAVPVAAYLFGALWGNARPSAARGWTERERVDRGLCAMRFAPASAVYAALALFLGAYLLFLLLQAGHLMTALNVGLPRTTTYSRFAREGFFELCSVCAINLGIMAAAWLLCVRKGDRAPKVLRVLLVILSLQTVLLAVTAEVKMGLYIQAYGLTRLRVYTAWFMIWLVAVFAVLALAQLRKIPAAKVLTALSVTMFLLLGYANVDAVIVRENLARYDANRMSLAQLNVGGLASLSADAELELLRYCEEGGEGCDPLRREHAVSQIRQALRYSREYQDDGSWYHLNGAKLRLKQKENAMNL